MLAARLAELREASLVETTDAGYALTRTGAELGAALAPLGRWSERWARELGRARGGTR